MTEFTAGARLEVDVPQSQLTDVRQDIEDELSDIELSVSGSASGSGGAASRMLDTQTGVIEDLVDLATDRNELLEEILDAIEDQGGGGGLLPSLPRGGGRRRGGFGGGKGPTVVPVTLPDLDPSGEGGESPATDPRNEPVRAPDPFGFFGDPNSGVAEEQNDDQEPDPEPDPHTIIGGIGAGALSGGLLELGRRTISGGGGGGSPASGSPGLGFPAPINPNTADLFNLSNMIPNPSGPGQRQEASLQASSPPTVTTTETVNAPDQQTSGRTRRKKDKVDVTVEVNSPDTRQIVDEIRRELDRELGREATSGIAGGGLP